MLISVCLTVLNEEKYLEQCLESIVNQTYENIEVIIVDGYSTDSTWDIIKSYTSRDSRIRAYRSHLSHVECIGLGYDLAKGDCICTVDGDDYIELSCIEKCVNVMNQTGVDVVYTQCEWFGDICKLDNRAFYPFDKDRILTFMMVFHFRLIKRNKWEEVRPFSPIKHYWDHDLVVRLSEVATFELLPEVLYYWRRSSKQITTSKNVPIYKADREIIQREARVRRANPSE